MSSLEDYFASLYAEAAVAGGGTGQATATITPPSLPGAGLAESRPQTNVGIAPYAAPAPSSTMTLDQFLATQQPADYYGMGEPVRNNYLQPQAQPAEPPMTQEEFDYGLLQLGATPYAARYTEEQIYALRSAVGQAQDAVQAYNPGPTLREMALAEDPTQAIYGDPFGEAYRSVRNPINEVYKDYLRDPILKPAVSTALDYLKPVAPNLGFNVNRDILGPIPKVPEITNRGLTNVIVPQNIEQALLELVPGIGTVPGTTSALRNAARQVLDNPALLRRLALAQGKSMDEIAALVGRMLDPDYAAVRTAKGGSGLSDEAYDALKRTPGAAESVMKTTPDVVPSRTALPEAGKTITRNFNQTGVTITGEELPNTYQVTIGRGRQLATGRGEGSDLTALSDARHFLKTLQEENPEARFIGFPT